MDRCAPIEEDFAVAGSWGCCMCKTFNGGQRARCKHCEHPRCDRVVDAKLENVRVAQDDELELEAPPVGVMEQLLDHHYAQQRRIVRGAVKVVSTVAGVLEDLGITKPHVDGRGPPRPRSRR